MTLENPTLVHSNNTVSPSLQTVLNRYMLSFMQRGMSENTIKVYTWHLTQFLAFLTENGLTLETLDEDTIIDWHVAAYRRWKARATVRQAMIALVGFLRWAYEKSLLKEDMARYVIVPTVKMEPQRTLWREEIDKMFATCGTSPLDIRDAAIMGLMLDSGLRSAEVCRLALDDVDLAQRSLRVIVKGGYAGIGKFGDKTVERLKAWLAVRPHGHSDAFFTALGGTRFVDDVGVNALGYPLTNHGLRILLRKRGLKAGVKGVSPHSFRRAFAVLMAEVEASDELIAAWGRWESTKMIKRYRLALQAQTLYKSPVDTL